MSGGRDADQPFKRPEVGSPAQYPYNVSDSRTTARRAGWLEPAESRALCVLCSEEFFRPGLRQPIEEEQFTTEVTEHTEEKRFKNSVLSVFSVVKSFFGRVCD